MYELNVLKSFLNRDDYVAYRGYVKDKLFTKETQPLLAALDLWYKNNPKDCTVDDLCNLFFSQGVKNEDFYREVFSGLASRQPLESTKTLLEGFRRQRLMEDLSAAAYDASEGRKSIEHVQKLMAALEEPIVDETEFVTDDLQEILDSTVKTPGLRWRLNSLNRALGSLRKGDFGFIFARPEVGKTTFLASEITHMATQLPKDAGPILWLNNEEEGRKVKFRLFQSALGITKSEILANPKRVQEEYLKLTNGKILMVDDAGMTKQMVNNLCEKFKPSLVCIDQLDKVHGFENDREDLRLGEIYIWARGLAKRYCPVIGVCQASADAEGSEFPSMGEVSNSKTSKTAEADWILGIGAKNVRGTEFVRGISIPKNKLLGDSDSHPGARHASFQVLIKPEIQRYIDIG